MIKNSDNVTDCETKKKTEYYCGRIVVTITNKMASTL